MPQFWISEISDFLGQGHTEIRQVFISGAKKGITPSLKRKLKRRNAIEPVIRHVISDPRLSRNFLKGTQGDAINTLHCSAAHNQHKLLAKLRLLYVHSGISLYDLLIALRAQRVLA